MFLKLTDKHNEYGYLNFDHVLAVLPEGTGSRVYIKIGDGDTPVFKETPEQIMSMLNPEGIRIIKENTPDAAHFFSID